MRIDPFQSAAAPEAIRIGVTNKRMVNGVEFVREMTEGIFFLPLLPRFAGNLALSSTSSSALCRGSAALSTEADARDKPEHDEKGLCQRP
ncbi:hypothetical protein CO652_15310 [Rhizobium sp. H4]|nr:hypothetical protein CO652_15310 [Rhizobium sp. H4]